jgi:hypothetical protein
LPSRGGNFEVSEGADPGLMQVGFSNQNAPNFVLDSPRDAEVPKEPKPMEQQNFTLLSSAAPRALGSVDMVSRGGAELSSSARSYASDPGLEVLHGLFAENPEMLDLISPEMQALFLEGQAVIGQILGGDRHSELWENNREEAPKRPRGSPESQETPPNPSPKRLCDGVGGMETEFAAQDQGCGPTGAGPEAFRAAVDTESPAAYVAPGQVPALPLPKTQGPGFSSWFGTYMPWGLRGPQGRTRTPRSTTSTTPSSKRTSEGTSPTTPGRRMSAPMPRFSPRMTPPRMGRNAVDLTGALVSDREIQREPGEAHARQHEYVPPQWSLFRMLRQRTMMTVPFMLLILALLV